MFDDVTLPKRSLEDLHDIVSEVSYIMRLASAAEVSRAIEHDEDVLESYLNYAYRLGVPVPKHIDSELFSLLNELGKLKDHFKMPRPLNIAAALGRELPRVPQSRWEQAYSYPSGHAFLKILGYLKIRGSNSSISQMRLRSVASSLGCIRCKISESLVDSLTAYSPLRTSFKKCIRFKAKSSKQT
jgi:hypothetical protein